MNLLWLTGAFLKDPENWTGRMGILLRVQEHLLYTFTAVGVAVLIALPLGLWLGHRHRGIAAVVAGSAVLRALPTLGVVTLIAVGWGLDIWPASWSLVILAIPAILSATATGIAHVDADTVDASRAIGMTEWQVLTRTEIPLASGEIFTGLRQALLQVIATVPVLALLPLGGLGRFLIDGLALSDYGQVAVGAILVGLLAVVMDQILDIIQRYALTRIIPHRR